MITAKIEEAIKKACETLSLPVGTIVLEHPADLSHGDFSTNVAMVLAKGAGKNPKVLAEEIVATFKKDLPEEIAKIEVAGPGFINFHLSEQFFADSVTAILESGKTWGENQSLSGKKIMIEYTQPNPFKPFHIGHLMSNTIGESLSRIIEVSGAKTVRANYQGDVGPHVAKAIWELLRRGKPDPNLSMSLQAQYIGECYTEGSQAYESNDEAKLEIEAINKKIYERSDSAINDIYDWGREVTLAAFEEIYTILGTKFDYYFFESIMAPIGIELVQEFLKKGIFTESDGAIVFKGEEHDPSLHTRVFINSKGLPTYETKEIGLTVTKFEKENPDLSIVTTAIEQGEYMKVVVKAIEAMRPDLKRKMKHITHGMMRFASGKMSSRTGNVVTGESLIIDSREVVREKVADRDFNETQKQDVMNRVAVAAIKYSVLRSAIGGDIIYDFDKSISFEGDSGPYLQYSTLRAKSVLDKEQRTINKEQLRIRNYELKDWKTTTLEKLLYRFPETVLRAVEHYEPHHITTYLTVLAGEFNSFYANEQILNRDDGTTPYRLALTEAFLTTMQNGLHHLGITLPEKM